MLGDREIGSLCHKSLNNQCFREERATGYAQLIVAPLLTEYR
jgi:hypothetical protein